MEPTGYGNRDRSHPLRSSPSRDRKFNTTTYQQKNHSLSGSSQHERSQNSNVFKKDEKFEQRRQDELKRQICAKEKELEQISKSKD